MSGYIGRGKVRKSGRRWVRAVLQDNHFGKNTFQGGHEKCVKGKERLGKTKRADSAEKRFFGIAPRREAKKGETTRQRKRRTEKGPAPLPVSGDQAHSAERTKKFKKEASEGGKREVRKRDGGDDSEGGKEESSIRYKGKIPQKGRRGSARRGRASKRLLAENTW